ncbi:hypothetical protein ACF0H5_012554 [Mactra antiquata]
MKCLKDLIKNIATNLWLRFPSVHRKYALLCVLLTLPVVVYVVLPVLDMRVIFGKEGKPCKLHELDPWDKSLQSYLVNPNPVKCAQKHSLLFVDESGFVHFNHSALKSYSLTSLKCVYHVIKRVDGDKDITIGDPVEFSPPFFVPSSVFLIECMNVDSVTVYKFVHFNMLWNLSQTRESEIEKESESKLSIIYFGLDSASRSHALRKLPKVYRYMKEDLQAYDFQGYMKVGLNSFPNLVPLLAGKSHDQYAMENLQISYLDSMPFIWNEKSMKNHVTLHSEDRPDIATMNYLHAGFKKQPVDYYYRPFALAMDQIEPIIMEPLGKSTWHCYGNKDHYLLQIDFLKRFLTKYSGRQKFSFTWNNQIGHETFISLGNGDQPLYDLLKWMRARGHLDKSILIVGSDHGFRLGGASTTYVGRLENNMPFLMVYVPQFIKDKYPWVHRNLKYNTRKLITPYDVHQTMVSVLNGQYSETVSQTVYHYQTSRCLFSKIPDHRTCVDAGIPDQYCTCFDSNPVDTSIQIVKTLANFGVEHLNELLQKYKNLCRILTLKNITEAKVMYTAEGDSDNSHIDRNPNWFKRLLGYKEDNSGRYVLMLYTSPNNGLIEIMIDFEEHPQKGFDNKMTVIGEPVRVNKYGNQSHCIEDPTLRQYCLCHDIKVTP